MEPRSVCYISRDPVFMDIYNSGKDAYMELAKITWPEKSGEPDFKANYRRIAKVCMISSIYGQGDKGLAIRAGVPKERVTEMKKAMFGTWKEVNKYRIHKINHLTKTGRIETYLGDRISADVDKAVTKGVNYCHQGNTSVIATEAFENAIIHIRELLIDLCVECICHDSNTNNFPIWDLFECDLCYQRYFRQYTNEKYGVDFKYDLDIAVDSCNNMKYSVDWKTREGCISGNKEAVDYVFQYLKEPDITILEDEVKDQHSDPLGDFLKKPYDRSHHICTYPEFLHPQSRCVKFRVNRKVRGEELIGTPTGTFNYFDIVKRWDEHLVPGDRDGQECDEKGVSLGIKDNPNKIYPVEIMDRILKEDY